MRTESQIEAAAAAEKANGGNFSDNTATSRVHKSRYKRMTGGKALLTSTYAVIHAQTALKVDA